MIITNVNLVLPNEVVKGSVEVIDGNIRSMSNTLSQLPQAIDGNDGFLMPGLIELHTDNLEKYFAPRPKVDWPPLSAMKAHDTQLIGAGITTVLNALALGDHRGKLRHEILDQQINTVVQSQKNGTNRVDHRLHLRCEVPHNTTVEIFERYINTPGVQLVSLMDHAPGQRQFVNIEKYRTYYQGKYGYNDAQMMEFETQQREYSERWSAPNREEICGQCRSRNIPMASHDDATQAHAEESKDLGMVIAEFPTTMEAAKASRDLGLHVLMGAPNVIRGGSHSGNIAAHELATAGALDILSSDYYPVSLLDAIFTLAHDPRNKLTLADAVKLATFNPAQSLQLHDRGVIEEGKRADLLLTHYQHGQAYIDSVWREGKKVF